jgi:hypothetical protein
VVVRTLAAPQKIADAERSLTESRVEFENNLQALQRELADCDAYPLRYRN